MREQLTTVVTNLLLNAREAVGADGRITVATSVADGRVMLAVSDNGPGMSRRVRPQTSLFRPFQTTKKKGLGIGMFQSKLIVEAHQRPPAGPERSRAAAPPFDFSSPPTPAPMKPKLLIVDDDEDIRTQMKWALSKEYDVALAEDRPSALEAFASRPPVGRHAGSRSAAASRTPQMKAWPPSPPCWQSTGSPR